MLAAVCAGNLHGLVGSASAWTNCPAQMLAWSSGNSAKGEMDTNKGDVGPVLLGAA